MKRGWKLSCGLLLSALLLSACGSSGQSGGRSVEPGFSAEALKSGQRVERSVVCAPAEGREVWSAEANDGGILYSVVSLRQTSYYFARDPANPPEEPFCVYPIATADVLDCTPGEDNKAYFIVLEVSEGKEFIYLRETDTLNGESADIKLLNDFHKGEKDECYEWKVELLPEERFLVYSHLGFWLLDRSGEILKEESWEEYKYFELLYLEDPCPFVQRFEKVSRLNPEDGSLDRLEHVPGVAGLDFIPCGENRVLMRTESELLSYDVETGETESILRWSDYGVLGDKIKQMYLMDNTLHCLTQEGTSLTDVAWTGEADREKKELTLGCTMDTYTLRAAVVEFNNSHPEYHISVKEYKEDYENPSSNRLLNDILTGKGPDIILFDRAAFNDIRLGEKGLLEDLNGYLERSRVIGREKLIESIYEALQWEGKLYMLPTNFQLDTMITKEKWKPESGVWSVEEFQTVVDANPQLQLFASKQNMLSDCVSFHWNESREISEEKLRTFLELANRMPDIAVYEPRTSVRQEEKALFDYCMIDEMKYYQAYKNEWGEDSVYVGRPGAKGNGMAFYMANGYGISSRSEHKEAAWEFLESFFTEGWQERITPNWDFSVCKEVFDRQMEEAMYVATYEDRDGTVKEYPIISYESDVGNQNVYAPREEDVADFRQMVEGTKVVKRDVTPIRNIVEEEAGAYFAGQKTVDEVMEIIEQRLRLLLSE